MNNNNNGVLFNGGQGPLMSGTWVNPTTGDSFTVRDSFFEDNQYMVQTMDGRMLNYNQLQNYVQSQKTDEDLKMIQNNKQNNSDSDLPPEVASLIDETDSDILPEDAQLITGLNKQTIGNLKNNNPIPVQENPNNLIIKKALSKCDMPNFDVNIKWKNEFPKKELDLLMNIMDININEIISYYINNIDIELIKKYISDELIKDIYKKLEISPVDVEPEIEEIPKKATPKRAPAKKTTTKKTE